MKLIDGKSISLTVLDECKSMVTQITRVIKRSPKLIVYRVGDHTASIIYTETKQKAGQKIGVDVEIKIISLEKNQDDLIGMIERDNMDDDIDGIIVQLPLPPGWNVHQIINTIDPKKDVDGLTDWNMGRLASGKCLLRPCTPRGVVCLLKRIQPNLKGLDALVVGKSSIVGKPMALELLSLGCTVTIAHKATKNLKQKVEGADLVVSATGNPNVIDPQWFKPSSIVIDVGISRNDKGGIRGDIDHQLCNQVSYITPVPGGVGPMTVAMLLRNVILACVHRTDAINILDLTSEDFT